MYAVPAGFMDSLSRGYVARVDKSKPRQTTTCSASDNVFANLFEIFIDQVSGAANLEKKVVPVRGPCNREPCFAQIGEADE